MNVQAYLSTLRTPKSLQESPLSLPLNSQFTAHRVLRPQALLKKEEVIKKKMSSNRRLNDDGGNVSHNQSSASKYSHDDQVMHSGNGGKVGTPIRHDYHSPYEMGQDSRIPKIVPRNESRDAERRSPLLPNMLFRVSTSNDAHSDHAGSKDNIKADRDLKSDSEELQQSAKTERYDSSSRGNDAKDEKRETKLDMDVSSGSNSQLGWKHLDEQIKAWHTSRTSLQGPAEAAKEGLQTESRDLAEASEAVRENKVDMKGDDKFREKDRKRKEMKHRDWAERDKERSDRRNNLPLAGSSGENKEVQREEKESEKWAFEKKDTEKLHEKEKAHIKRESLNGSDKDTFYNEKELVGVPGKSAEQEISMLEPKKKDHDTWKNVERETRDKKKERDADIESERPDKRGRFHGKEPEDCGMESEGGVERERETFNIGVQQRKRMLRPKGSPQSGNRDLRVRPHSKDNEGSQGQADLFCVVYKNGECMQELVKLWKEHEQSHADKACESLPNGPTLEIRIPAEHVTATNRQVRVGQLWGTDVYTVDSDLVAVLMHTGYYRPTASPPPPATQELRVTVRVLPAQDGYVSTLRNNVRSRAWGAAVGCSYCVERCCILKKGGGIVELEPCLTHSSTMEPTLAPVAVERTMTTRAAATNALRKQRFVREVTIQFNLCNEPWLKYSISAVADKGLKRPLFTSARLKKGEVLYLESHFYRYELCFSGEKVLANGERMNVDGENTVVDVFRWSRLKRPIPRTLMPIFGIPLPLEKVKVVEDGLEWDDISWSQTGVWISGREYHLSRTLFLSAK